MALVKLSGLVQGKHDHPLAAPREKAIDSFRATAEVGGSTATWAVARIEETNDEGNVIGFFPVVARGEAAEALNQAQWKHADIMASARIRRDGQWELSVISVSTKD